MTNPAYEATNSDAEKLISSIKVDIDKRKSMPPRGDANSNIERLRVMNDTMKSFSTESVEELISALEDANALNKHLDLAIRKAEGCSEALRRRAEAAENRIAELESAPNGMMQLSNELVEMKRKCVELTVWYGAMPESNGKTNWTAILHRKGECLSTGITIDRSEYPDRVRYEADRMSHLIGELTEEPDILAYDANKHSGYTARKEGE